MAVNPLSYLTFICCLVSLLGSILVITSYVIVRSAANPKAAQLIRNLALTDFVWFGSVLIQSSFWIAGLPVPDNVCYILSPTVMFFRMGSLVWTCAISFDVLMSVTRRKWYGKNEEAGWYTFRKYYYVTLLVLAFPVALFNIISQSQDGNASLGCNPEVEELGTWYIILLTEVLPISIGTIFNVFVFFTVRQRMGLKAYPSSVRKRRRRIMYHYIAVCIVCWMPTLVVYLILVIAEDSKAVKPGFAAFARATLYLSGFFNFLVFGMQDPHLKKSGEVLMHLTCHRNPAAAICCSCNNTNNDDERRLTNSANDVKIHKTLKHPTDPSASAIAGVKFYDAEKSVMFEEASMTARRQRSKDKYSKPTRHRRLSREEKRQLYLERPDLAPDYTTTAPGTANGINGANDSSNGNGGNMNEGGRVVMGVNHVSLTTAETDDGVVINSSSSGGGDFDDCEFGYEDSDEHENDQEEDEGDDFSHGALDDQKAMNQPLLGAAMLGGSSSLPSPRQIAQTQSTKSIIGPKVVITSVAGSPLSTHSPLTTAERLPFEGRERLGSNQSGSSQGSAALINPELMLTIGDYELTSSLHSDDDSSSDEDDDEDAELSQPVEALVSTSWRMGQLSGEFSPRNYVTLSSSPNSR